MRKFTTQEVIDMGSDLYDNKGFNRVEIRKFLNGLVNGDLIEYDSLESQDPVEDVIDSIFDLIVG